MLLKVLSLFLGTTGRATTTVCGKSYLFGALEESRTTTDQ